VLLAKIQRDIKTTEEIRHETQVVQDSSCSDEESQSNTKPPNKRDFFDVLFEATGSFFCGAVIVGTKSTYYGVARKRSKRKKQKKRPKKDVRDDPDDPLSGLENDRQTI
jgi:hypothetical protein